MKRAALLLLMAAATAHAQDCATIADSSQRLACYDAQAKQPAPATPAPAATPPAADSFGKAWQERDETLAAHLAYPVPDLQKGSLLTLDNGQVWKCTYTPLGFYKPIAAGTDITLRKDMFGGYRAKIGSLDDELKVKRLK